MVQWIQRLMLVVMLCAGVVRAELSSIEEVRYLAVEKAAEGVSVELEAQVTHLHPRRHGIYLFDGKYGLFVRLPGNPGYAGSVEDLKPGSMVRIKGVTTEGGFVPDVNAQEIEVTGWMPLPKPRKFGTYEIRSPNIAVDCEWVLAWGRIVSATLLEEYDHVMLELEVQDTVVDVQIPYADDTMEKLSSLMYQRVEFPAVVGTVYNRHRQMTGRIFLVNSPDDFEVNTEGDEWVDQDVRPIEALMRAGMNYQKSMHTRGTVTYVDDHFVYLRGDESSLMVATLGGMGVTPGDYVDFLGFIWPRPISPAFRAREVDVLEQRAVPEPKAIDVGAELNADWHYELVETEAVLVDIGESFGLSRFSEGGEGDERVEAGRVSLLCRSGDRVFEARVPKGQELTAQLRPGAKLRLTGICQLVRNRDPRWDHFSEGVWLDLRRTDGIQILELTPWWTTRRLAWGIGIVLSVASLFLVWVVLLRMTVHRQTDVIGEQIERESVLNERQRIARELHDTLEQALSGMALQLKNVDRQMDKGVENGRDALKLAQGMLRYCRDESRSSILDLRGGLLETMNLPDSIRTSLKTLAVETDAILDVQVIGESHALDQFVDHHLMRMAKEAATNAVRHASPSRITVTLNYGDESVVMCIEDDGAGFSVDTLEKSERFGLQGMRERAKKINGAFSVESVEGKGTTVRVEVKKV